MIEYRTYRKIRHLWLQRNIPLREIARMLSLSRQTVQKWSKKDKHEDGWQAKQKSQDKDFENTNSTAVTQPVVVQRTFLDSNKSWMLMLLL